MYMKDVHDDRKLTNMDDLHSNKIDHRKWVWSDNLTGKYETMSYMDALGYRL